MNDNRSPTINIRLRSSLGAGDLRQERLVLAAEKGEHMKRSLHSMSLTLVVAAISLTGSLVGVASAGVITGNTYYVASTGDAASSATQGVCEQKINTTCTLRTAIAFATIDGAASTDTINITATKPINLSSVTGPLLVSTIGFLTISGQGASKTFLSGGNKTEVMAISNGVTATVNNLTIENGFNSSGSGGGISNGGTLNLNSVNFTGNTSYKDGGAVYSSNTLAQRGGIVSKNYTEDGCGSLYAKGSSALISSVTVINNSTDCGGGVVFSGGVNTLKNSLIANNSSRDYDDGGGVWADGGTITIVNNTITGNTSAEYGGGIDVNSTSPVLIQNNTIVKNVALQGGGGIAISSSDHQVTMQSNIITGNTEWPNISNQCVSYSAIYATSFNVVGPAKDQGCVFNGPGDRTEQSVTLSPLGSHGGATSTYLLAAGSAGLGSVAAAFCPVSDARNVSRPAAGAGAPCDAGAVEVGLSPSTVTCSALSGKLTTTIKFSACTPSLSGSYASASGPGFALSGGTTRLTWKSSNKSSSLSLGGLSVASNHCPAGSSEFRVNGAVTQSSGKSPVALSKVTFLMCQAANGTLSLLRATQAKL